MSSSLPSFPPAQQAQTIRANQRDLFHVLSLKEHTENTLRAWLGTRLLSRWDKEIELGVKLLYYGLTTGRAVQTLGEEYTDIWLHSSSTNRRPSAELRAALILLPTLPWYLLARFGSALQDNSSFLTAIVRRLPTAIEVISEINLAIFYLRGTYYDLSKRILGIRQLSSIPEDPRTRPPSYALLGILLGVRLMHRLFTSLRALRASREAKTTAGHKSKQSVDALNEAFIDDRAVSTMLGPSDPEGKPVVPAEEDDRTVLDMAAIPEELRTGRNCTLCLEERTASCATECGHLFCWDCIVGWGREKPECPLCRQSLSLSRLLPIHNL
ncbi:hypothetical protein GLOTRDRAFT_102715 [Gloeophyllum trabeum ATCC 11539]|uniref:RING-type E3 ubiquitin transferase n=1 Tax=Gloeophyllum trabeum (strain ATCC 11539 / FP-39264 / Madison 617) TaxID=670483 RepID=S7S1Q9_GLOTA|nr:uncharacterized protein GLOTRDRAFT_102715 [Gloeophyllum trabeum ATCC 11539]EPQ61390.1 hypothetical protein GLOTRDRAFT_102715 [Gloeophyllum trabeum ATCC 11539]